MPYIRAVSDWSGFFFMSEMRTLNLQKKNTFVHAKKKLQAHKKTHV